MAQKHRYGKAFSDGVFRFSSSHHNKKGRGSDEVTENLLISDYDDDPRPVSSTWRKVTFLLGVIFVFSIFFIRLFHLQVVEGSHNRDLADSNRIQIKTIHAPRGVIYDRNGKILAQNEPAFRLVERNGDEIKVSTISRDEALKMEVAGDPRFNNLEVDTKRTYPMGEITSHILGYVGEISGEELKSTEYKNYTQGDKIGRGGIEESYEKILRGVDGGEVIEYDAAGKKVRTLSKKDPIPGQNLYLTIDSDLQKVATEKLQKELENEKVKSCCGAVVASQPQTGEILALVSLPSFDPKDIGKALVDPRAPLLNRAIGGEYAPGSTFKIVSTLAGFTSGKITPQTTFEDTGVVKLGPYSFANWYFTQHGRTEGQVDAVKALQRSNDIYYYLLGNQVGEDEIGKVARDFGLGSKTGIDIPGETAGVIPNNDWKVKNLSTQWYPGDTLHMSIGQGFVLSTPLQVNLMTSAIAANGSIYPPHLAQKITDQEDRVIKTYSYDGSRNNRYSNEQIEVIKRGLELVPKAGGTAWPFFSFPIPTAGKTGTAEFGAEGKTHAWYTSYAPLDDPRITMTVLVEGGGEGSTVAGSISKEIYRWYFSENKNDLLKDVVAPVATESARSLGE